MHVVYKDVSCYGGQPNIHPLVSGLFTTPQEGSCPYQRAISVCYALQLLTATINFIAQKKALSLTS